MPRTVNIGGVDTELWLYAGDRVTDDENNDVDDSDLIFRVLEADGTRGDLLSARVDDDTAAVFVPRTNFSGVPPRYLLPATAAWASANAGTDWFLVATAEQADLRAAVLASSTAATTAATQANAAATSASSAASSAAASLVAQRAAATYERVQQAVDGTWTPTQSVIPRIFVRTVVGSPRPTNATILGSDLIVGDRVEHEVDLP